MNGINPPPQDAANPKPTRRPAPVKKPRAPRKIDPDVEAIRKEAAEKIKQLHVARGSEKILHTIVGKRLPKMTQFHRQALFDELAKTCQPALIPAEN